ncbi:WD repeat-containing protein 6 [Rhinatrema bivittatum]|uniref:WD repeat-containing protein 6 n=1 Tax=Rhinatrema bivittatum TaxID=194408 RepID=UPI001129EBD2|nr:WD repeat-containing protein 6 [Rhinatrema bivittatum]XP_029457115.1 WD repeat-containing protein 6 [Rhinatrema bivittatum]XP_029457116.1 WD repeat-containing protein 6 [Rhinatrema bivittatum]
MREKDEDTDFAAMLMESVLLLTPVTALEFVGDHLLSGEGPNLTVHILKHGGKHTVRHSQSVLRNYNIHKIKHCICPASGDERTVLAVFGGKGLIILQLITFDDKMKLIEVCQFQELHDWIWDLQWLKNSPEIVSYVALALGHNSVVLYDYTTQRILKEVHCEEKCILYSAHFVGNSWNELCLIAGTVFNQLVVWRMVGPIDDAGRIKPKCRISGHSGVIFSIFYLESKGLLASASDDRSLRVWYVGDLKATENPVQCRLVLYGHQSRVWSVKLLSDCIISIGEDSACIVWNYTGDIMHHFKGHKGRSIRAMSVHETNGWVATGGADFGIKLWNINGNKADGSGLLQLNFSASNRKGTPKAVKLVDINCLLIMTDTGGLYTYDLTCKIWKFVLEDTSYQSYSLLEVVRLTNNCVICAIGNITGHIKLFTLCHPEEAKDLRLYEGKVHNLTWTLPQGQTSDLCNLFSSGPDGILIWLEISCSSGQIKFIAQKCQFCLPLCKQRWHTSLAFLPKEELIVVGDRRGSLLLYSCTTAQKDIAVQALMEESGGTYITKNSMCHNLELANMGEQKNVSSRGQKLQAEGPSSFLFGVHGKLGVTSVSHHDDLIYSTGRDGCYCQLNVEKGQLKVLRKQKPCKGMDWIEKLCFTPTGDLLVMGFHSTNFVLWSTRTSEKLLCVPCGGGHRSWSYDCSLSTKILAYIKSGDIFIYQNRSADSSQCVLKDSLHGRELTCVRHIGTIQTSTKQAVNILLTGSEDTTVSILAFNELTNKIFQLTTISTHISSVRALASLRIHSKKLENSPMSTVFFSAGGRAEIECYRLLISCECGNNDIRCQVIHVASHRLDEHWDCMKNKHKVIKMDPETRYMSIVVVDEERDLDSRQFVSSSLFLAAACSDGSVRLFLMSECSQKLLLIAESSHHQRCVLKVETFMHRFAAGRRRVFLCSTATDGIIAFWDITTIMDFAKSTLELIDRAIQPKDLGIPLLTVQAHQSGINSLHVQKTEEGYYLVASGGDDNSIHICVLAIEMTPGNVMSSKLGDTAQYELDCGSCIQLLKKFVVVSAHAAHITGLKLLQSDLLVSVSVDQRFTLWRLGDNGLHFLCSKFCHVPDVADLDCWTEGELVHYNILCGQGLQIIKYIM